jgi:phage tail sheath protein FI
MPAQYLHGVETIEEEIGGQTVQVVKSSIIALYGIAPIGPVNQLILCLNPTDDAQFGNPVPGFNIPKTLQIIRGIAGSTPILVVNTFDGTANTTQVTDEAIEVVNGVLSLSAAPVAAVALKNNDGTAATIVQGTDFTIDDYGNFKVISANITDGTTYKFSYKKLNPASVTPVQITGSVDGNNARTGIALYDLSYNMFGYKPKIFVAPGYSSVADNVIAMATAAAKFRAIYLVDAPYGTTIANAIAGRGVAGAIVFNTADPRAYLLYPFIKTFDDATQADQDYPYSAFMAGVIVANDLANGYWFSPSNKAIPNATGSERVIEWSINDASCEANQLNGAGITTIAAGYGTGMLTWGNRNASFPTSNSVKNFVSIRRTDDMVIESMEEAALPYIDQPINQAFIDTMREAGNTFMRTLIGRGAILPGSRVTYSKDDNPSDQLANGQIVFERTYMVPPPAERITYKDVLDISLLNQFQ